MKDNYIQLNKDDRLKLEIVTDTGESTGEYLYFDLEDIELPLKFQRMDEEQKKNMQWIRNQELIISKRQDVKGKKLLSKNEEDLARAYKEYFDKQAATLDIFLGENGVKKLLNGRPMGWTRLKEINEIIEKYILPKLDIKKDKVIDKIKAAYGESEEKAELK